jgi:multiple sugar transport system permease protein
MNSLSVRIRAGLWYVPAAVLVVLIFVYPILRTFSLSFMQFSLETGMRPRFAGTDNFVRLWSDSRFVASLKVTALFTVVSVALEFVLGLLSALAVEKIKKGRRAARTLLLIPWTLPTAIISVLWMWIFNDQFGLINGIFFRTGISSSPIAWLGKPQSALFAVIMADAWKAFPFVFIVLLAGLQGIPREMYEAIEIDGGTAWHKFRFVTVPCLMPFIFLALIFRIVQAFAVFDLVYVLTGGGPGGATETVSVYGYYTFMRYLDFGYGASLVVALVAVLAVVSGMLYWLLLRKRTAELR